MTYFASFAFFAVPANRATRTLAYWLLILSHAKNAKEAKEGVGEQASNLISAGG